ncbi:hypothetical protein ABPG77_005033 [Micractinium sp. CCAP 211/92]
MFCLPAVRTLHPRVLMKTAENSNSTDLIRAQPLCRQHPRCTEATPARLPPPCPPCVHHTNRVFTLVARGSTHAARSLRSLICRLACSGTACLLITRYPPPSQF